MSCSVSTITTTKSFLAFVLRTHLDNHSSPMITLAH
nr:MAG TPA: hypothetical protein [Caudoviricetes sp.]